MNAPKERRNHAIVLPWPVSSGLHTWCGYRIDSEMVQDEFIATGPEEVTCQQCAVAMKSALDNLTTWVPKLTI